MVAPIDPQVTTTALGNGLRVTTVELPHLHTAVVSVFIKVGARFESEADSGLSHFVEHMLFRGNAQHPTSLALNTAFESLGSSLHAETGRDYTLFQIGTAPDDVVAALELFGQFLGAPRFADIELERALVLEEINEDYSEEDIEINADDIARGLVFPGHPLGQRIIGPRVNVQRFSLEDVRRHFGRFYGARNMTLCVAGPVKHDSIAVACSRYLGDMHGGEVSEPQSAPPSVVGPVLHTVRDSGSQTSVCVLLRGVGELDPGYLGFVALSRLLDDGMSTRLHYQLADQKGLAYSIGAGIEPLVDTALLDIVGATANDKVPELVRELLSLLSGLRQGVIADDELAKARARYRYETLASVDDAAAMAAWFSGTALYYPPVPLSRRLAQIEAVTLTDVQAAAQRVLVPDNLVVAAVGALTRSRQRDLRQVIRDWK